MLARVFHNWERRLHAVDPNRVVRPFEWGLDWLPEQARSQRMTPAGQIEAWGVSALEDSDAFFALPETDDFRFDEATGHLRFPSALETPHAENNTVYARFFPATRGRGSDAARAVVVLPQWNADPEGHIGLSRLLASFGMSALRLSLPYHDQRRPAELQRADYIVSANVVRTVQVCRQAVLDARRAVAWLDSRGYKRIGILGTSLGSCLAMITAAHEPRLKTAALNHVSVYFADVVWEGLSTSHVRRGLEGHVDLPSLRRLWMPISPYPYVDRLRDRRSLLVYAKYDLTFPLVLSRQMIDEFRTRNVPHETSMLPCGHYTTGRAPFKWLDGFALTKFLNANL